MIAQVSQAAQADGFQFDSALVGALATLFTVFVGWYTARNARKGQRESHQVATKEQQRLDAEWIVEASRELASTIQEDLKRIRDELEVERELRESAQAQAAALKVKLDHAERQTISLMKKLDEAQRESERLRNEMDALRAEMRRYRGTTREPDMRTRWDDQDEGDFST